MFGPSKRQLFRTIERERQQHREELRDVLNRLADAYGRPWTPSPADTLHVDVIETEPAVWTPSPEQLPV